MMHFIISLKILLLIKIAWQKVLYDGHLNKANRHIFNNGCLDGRSTIINFSIIY